MTLLSRSAQPKQEKEFSKAFSRLFNCYSKEI